MKTRFWVFGLLIVLALGIAGCDRLPAASTSPTDTPVVPIVTTGGDVVVEGNVVPRDFTRVYTRVGGKVQEVLVKEGDVVAEGAPLVKMDGQDQAEAALSTAENEKLNAQQSLDKLNEKAALVSAQAVMDLEESSQALIEAQQELDDLDSDQYQTDLDNAKTDVSKAKDDLDDAQEEWDKNKDLDVDNTTRKNSETKLTDAQKKYDDAIRKRDLLENDLNKLKAAVYASQGRKDDAQREVDRTKDGAPNPNDLALAKSRLANAEAHVKAAQTALDDLVLKAPFAGTIVELDAVLGETMLPNQQLVMLADLSQLFIETSDLTEMDVVNVSEGQGAVITPDALSETELTAIVESIDQASGKKGGDVTYTVRLKLNETDPLLRWGMTVEVRFAGE